MNIEEVLPISGQPQI